MNMHTYTAQSKLREHSIISAALVQWKWQQEQWRGKGKTTPRKRMVSYEEATDNYSPYSGSSLVFFSASVLVITGSMRRYLQPPPVVQVVQHLRLIHGWHRFPVSSSTVSRVWRRSQTSHYMRRGELDRAEEGHQPINRTSICSYVRGRTGEALPEP